MAVYVVFLVFFLAIAGRSSATYCICKDGLGDSVYQKNIDYACGAGADCSPIIQTGACYSPNTVKDHCNYAVNSYFQKKGQATGSCDFAGTATQAQTVPNQTTGCSYPSTSTAGTPSTTTPSSTTPTTTPSTGTPSTTTPTGSTTTPPSVFGLGPTTGTGITNTDSSASVTLHQTLNLFYSFILTLFFSGLLCFEGMRVRVH